MMKRIVLALCFFIPTLRAAISDDVVEGIIRLRQEQRHASLGEYDAIQEQIEQIRKQDTDVTIMRDSPFFMQSARLSHLVPFIILQLLFCILLGALFLMRRGKALIFIFLLGNGILIWGGYRERSSSWKVVRAKTDLYLGPGSGYPVRRSLVPGDEVRIVSSSEKNGPTWILVDAYGVKGWLQHDVIS